MKYAFYEDPGHGWLKVPLKELEELDIADKISTYSYLKGPHAYLEEDCDAPIFMKTMEAKGRTVELDVHTSNRSSKIRGYPGYKHPN